MSCRDACWWASSGWFPGRRAGFGGIARRWDPPSLLGIPPWSSELVRLWPAVRVASVACSRQHRALPGPAFFVGPTKIVGAEVGRKSHRWELGVSVMGGRMKMKGWVLLSWHWSVNSANDEGFGHSQLGAHSPHPGFSGETSTKHLQPHSPYPGDSRFGNGIERALRPSGLVWSSGSLYPWNDGGYYSP